MDKIIIGHTDDPNYTRVGKLADGTTVYRYNPLPTKSLRIDETVIEEYNQSVHIKDTETQELLHKFHWDELKEQEKKELKEKIAQGYVEIYPDTPKLKPIPEKLVHSPSVDTDEYTQKLDKDDQKQRLDEQRQEQIRTQHKKNIADKKRKPVTVKKPTPSSIVVEEDTSHTSDYMPLPEKEKSPAKPEPKLKPPKQSDDSLVESYHKARTKGEEIEDKLTTEESESIADYYRKLKDTNKSPSEKQGEVLGYYDEPEDESRPVTDDTTEYLSLTQKQDIQNKLKERERKDRRKKHKDSLIDDEVIVEAGQDTWVPNEEEEEVDTSTYLDLFKSHEEAETQVQKEEERIKDEHVVKEEKQDEEKEEATKEHKKKAKQHRDRISKRVRKAQTNLAEKKEDLSKEYFRGLLEKAYAHNDELVELKYRQLKRDIEQEKLHKRQAAINYIDQLYRLSEAEKSELKLYEDRMAKQRDRVEADYKKILEEQSENENQGIYDEFNDYTTRINVGSKTVVVTNKETGNEQTFTYTGTLHTYKIDGYKLQLQAISRDPSTMIAPHAPGAYGTVHGRDVLAQWFVTHFFLTYDLRDGSLIENDSYTFVKPDHERDIDDDDYDYDFSTFESDNGCLVFTTGWGTSDCCSLSATWPVTMSPPNSLSAVAPDGYAGGGAVIGVERLLSNIGTITVRFLVSAGMPPGRAAAAPNDYTIDGGANVPGYPTGSGAYNYCYQGADSEVAFSSGGNICIRDLSAGGGTYELIGEGDGLADEKVNCSAVGNVLSKTYEVDPLSGTLQTLTWDDGEMGIKYINLEHCQLASKDSGDAAYKQHGYRWYAVYLTFDQSYQMGLSAGPGNNDDGYRYHNTRVPTACACIAEPGITGITTQYGIRGSVHRPFFVAISGWQPDQVNQFSCYPCPPIY